MRKVRDRGILQLMDLIVRVEDYLRSANALWLANHPGEAMENEKVPNANDATIDKYECYLALMHSLGNAKKALYLRQNNGQKEKKI